MQNASIIAYIRVGCALQLFYIERMSSSDKNLYFEAALPVRTLQSIARQPTTNAKCDVLLGHQLDQRLKLRRTDGRNEVETAVRMRSYVRLQRPLVGMRFEDKLT